MRLRVKHIDPAQNIIRIEQSKGRKDRSVMLPDEMLDLLRMVESACFASRCGNTPAATLAFSQQKGRWPADHHPVSQSARHFLDEMPEG